MNRHERRAMKREQHARVADLPDKLTLIPREEFPNWDGVKLPAWAWKSRKYLVQLYYENNADYPGLVRLSICRVQVNTKGGWQDGLTWEELQSIKREVGFGDWYGMEVYPSDQNVVNVANLRHLWLLPTPLNIGWFK